MATTRSKNYFAGKKNNPIQSKQEVEQSNDNKIDQDFPGFPHGQAKENIIKPQTDADAATAAIDKTDGEKRAPQFTKTDEAASGGSGNAFTGTEEVRE